MTTVTFADQRMIVELSSAGELLAVRPLTGADTVGWYEARIAAVMFPLPAGCELIKDSELDWHAARMCACVLPEHHCQACEGAAANANH